MASKQDSKPTPQAVSLEPPKISGKGKTPIHTPEIIKAIAAAAGKGWTSNGLEYKTKSGAQGALQTVKEAIVAAGFAEETGHLSGRVWSKNGDEGPYVFAVAAKSAVAKSD